MRKSSYDLWIESQGVPVIKGYGIENILDVSRSPDARVGGLGARVKLEGSQGETAMYVHELPPSTRSTSERHLYEEMVYVLRGQGTLEVRHAPSGRVTALDWEAGGLFGIPVNADHVLINRSSTEPAILLQFTNAPVLFDVFHNESFILGAEHAFDDRYAGQEDYYRQERRYVYEPEDVAIWQTNYVPDIVTAFVESDEKKGEGMRLTQCEMADGVLVAHIADWPVDRYHKGHYHGAGAVLLIVQGSGYSLMWPREAGTRPFEAGNADAVVRVDWTVGAVFSPPDGWFHQHFNTSDVQARQLAFRYGSRRYFVEFHDRKKGKGGPYRDIKQGGTMIEYADEDPYIRQLFLSEVAARRAGQRDNGAVEAAASPPARP